MWQWTTKHGKETVNVTGLYWYCVVILMFLLLMSQVLLQSDKVPANFSDRSLLKNLGHWLGLQTLARNKPILMKVLNDVCSLGYGSRHGLKAACSFWCLSKESKKKFTGKRLVTLLASTAWYNCSTSYVELCVSSWKVISFSCRILIWSHWLLKLTSKDSRYINRRRF